MINSFHELVLSGKKKESKRKNSWKIRFQDDNRFQSYSSLLSLVAAEKTLHTHTLQ